MVTEMENGVKVKLEDNNGVADNNTNMEVTEGGADTGVKETNEDANGATVKSEPVSPNKNADRKNDGNYRNFRRYNKRSGKKPYTMRDSEKLPPLSEGGVNVFRIKVSGLPRFYSPLDPLLVEFKKMLRDELKLNFHYVRSPKKGNSWLYITFPTVEDQMKALNILKRYTWKERTIIGTLVVADLKRKTLDDQDESNESKKAKFDIPIEEQMLMSTIPYHSITYTEQLSKKNEETISLLKWLNGLTEKRNHLLSGWFDEQASKNENKLPFKLEEVRQSPIIDGYRNKCEFRIGRNRETNAVTVGYRVDNQHDGSVDVALPDSLRHLPKQMIQVAKDFEKFIQNCPLTNVTEGENVGILKIMTVRMNKAGQLMLVITVRHNELPEEEMTKLKKEIINFFANGDGKACNVVSLYLFVEKEKDIGDLKKIVPVEEHIWGSKYLEEDVHGLKLEITPDFYFQCNTYSAEVLYQAVAELASVDGETTVLDLCCGSGGMGMVLAKQAKEVLGVELMDANVEGAKKLSLKNGLQNCEFVQGKVDDVYDDLVLKLKGKKVVPILDPPRAGISQSMIINLRKLEEADKLIYVCSNHKLPLKNLLDLATDSAMFEDTDPFVVTKVIPIDVSPHTLRCELVILCERLDRKTLPKPTREPKAMQNVTSKKKRRFEMYMARRRGYNSGSSRSRDGYQGGRGSDYQSGRKLPSLMNLNLNKSNFNSRGSYSVSARDSLYPPPLRDALYNNQSSWNSSQNFDYRSTYQNQGSSYGNNYYDSGRGTGNWGNNYGRNSEPDNYFTDNYDYETRYSNFRRDFEAAINSSFRSTSGRFNNNPRPLMRGSGGGGGSGSGAGGGLNKRNNNNRKGRMYNN